MTPFTKNALKVFEYALTNNLAGTQKELCDKIGLRQQNLADIKSNKRSFTHEQLIELLRLTGASADWVYGLSGNMFREKKTKKPIQQFNEAVAVIKELVK